MSQMTPNDAATVVNTYDHAALTRILRLYGEMQQPQLIASDIIMARESEPIETTMQLKAAVERRLPRGKENKVLAQLFQALRIEVNQELEALTAFLAQCPDVLKPGGRLVVMSYHSLEDRLVKNFMKTGNAEGKEEKDFFGNLITPYTIITRKPIVPSDEEMERNPRARSAKLRIAERK
jgi:16S rRNA (cytosine1402-N4)-methyltransferase